MLQFDDGGGITMRHLNSGLLITMVLLILTVAGGSGPVVATTCGTIVNCGDGPFGCYQPGGYCCDQATGAGACKNLPFLVCVCDPSEEPPQPEDPNPDDWSSGGDTGQEPQEPPAPPAPGAPPQYDNLQARRNNGPLESVHSLSPAFPQVGDVLCATQSTVASFLHSYNSAWGAPAPETVTVSSSRFCLKVVGHSSANWWEIDVQEFQATMPSFVPNGLPGHPTGTNHVTLDTIPSKGKLFGPTGELFIEFNLQLTNLIFVNDFAAPVRAGFRGTLNVAQDRLTVARILMTAMTPPDYQGPHP